MFIVEKGEAIIDIGKPIYRVYEQSFDFISLVSIKRNYDALLGLDTIMIPVNILTGIVGGVWGYHPKIRQHQKSLTVPLSRKDQVLRYQYSKELEAGQFKRITELSLTLGDVWPYLTRSHDLIETPDFVCEFATNTLAEIHQNRLTGLWIKPRIIESPTDE